jgi:hypothetical protein
MIYYLKYLDVGYLSLMGFRLIGDKRNEIQSFFRLIRS